MTTTTYMTVQNVTTKGRKCFVRWGALPSEQNPSLNKPTMVASRNHRDGCEEPGVSVFAAYSYKGVIYLDLRGMDSTSARFICNERTVYRVRGEVVGKGSDGEPCLRPSTCKARKVADLRKTEEYLFGAILDETNVLWAWA